MTPVFADTFYFLACINSNDAAHDRALKASQQARPMLTSWFVLLELADALSEPPARRLFERILDALRNRHDCEIAPLSDELLDDALSLYGQRPDQSWSLTDCTSFVLMTRRGVSDALTGDRHFQQAGFVAMLA